MAKVPAEVVTHCPNPQCEKPIYSDHIYSWCVGCGDPLPESVQAQIPHLRALKEKDLAESPPVESLSDRALLERLVRVQEEQGATLAAIRQHTGCVYAWVILSILLGALAVFMGPCSS